LTDLILLVFQTSVDLAALGPAHAGDPDMISMRWRLLNALSDGGKTAAQLGRELGMTRQGALLNVRFLEGMGYVTQVDNPTDKRANKASLTRAGERKLAAMNSFQTIWVNRMATRFKKADVDVALDVVEKLRLVSIASVNDLKD
jgi:DNA-binding MarR family transcriptional regulator